MKNELFPLSIIILTHRKDEQFLDALQSAQWADDVIVGDNTPLSTWDDFKQNNHFRVVKCTSVNDFSATRNQLRNEAKNDWILFVDCDEVISEELKTEIQETLRTTDTNGLYVRRQDFFLKKTLYHGEVGNITLLRLMRKNSGHWQGKVHETFMVEHGKVGHLTSPLFHYPHHSIHHFITKINAYSTLRSEELHEQDISFSFLEMVLKPIGKFIYNYLFKLGFLDGWRGLVYASVMSLHSLAVRIKLYEKEKVMIPKS